MDGKWHQIFGFINCLYK